LFAEATEKVEARNKIVNNILFIFIGF